MSAEPAFGGGTFVADKSAWARSHKAAVRDEWARALEAGQIATCQITELELLYSARNATEFAEIEAELSILRLLPVTQTVCEAAVLALRELAANSDGYHRVSPPDALVAATAAEAGLGVLHYDGHFDRLSEVLDFESKWIAVAGSVD
jgi:predicted nucleic acid-binding protein